MIFCTFALKLNRMNMDYWNETAAAVTICDCDGIVVYCNKRSAEQFAKYGDLLGKNLKDCHGPTSWQKICRLIETGESNIYTIEKKGVKKLIHQMPWREQGEIKGLIEISFELPSDMQHFVRE